MFLPTLTVLLFPLASHAQFELQERTVAAIVDHYRPQVQRRFGRDVELVFKSNSTALQATGGHLNDGRIEVTVYGGVFRIMDLPEITFTLCHEIGHILGEVTFADVPENMRPRHLTLPNALEGEADYFGGNCALEMLGDADQARASALKALEKIYGQAPRPEQAMNALMDGIEAMYPGLDCRALSALNGVAGLPRPRCWFNP